ncbi:MAG TPA: hypothetical protein VJ866_16155 [Pyrinomonadaceae bacterium]|nr:hypothetical protein [Pyrinomonadaceae bacterium]
MYKPNFCSSCGERVVRPRWRLWTSRRFCEACERRQGRGSLTATGLLLVLLGGGGFLLGRFASPARPPLIVERGGAGLVPLSAPAAPRPAGETREGANVRPEPSYGPDGTANERPTDPEEVVYICGARTKKGTPCQRRVRGPGRCWQHRGKPAMLPPSKLVVPG